MGARPALSNSTLITQSYPSVLLQPVVGHHVGAVTKMPHLKGLFGPRTLAPEDTGLELKRRPSVTDKRRSLSFKVPKSEQPDVVGLLNQASSGSKGKLKVLELDQLHSTLDDSAHAVAVLLVLPFSGEVRGAEDGPELSCWYANEAAIHFNSCSDFEGLKEHIAQQLQEQPALSLMLESLIRRCGEGQAVSACQFLPRILSKGCQTGGGTREETQALTAFFSLQVAACVAVMPTSAQTMPALMMFYSLATSKETLDELFGQLVRDNTALGHVPSLVSMYSTDGAVLHQNPKAIIYMGFAQGQPLPRCDISTDGHPIAKLFALEPIQLDDMRATLGRGQAWRGRVRMPAVVSLLGSKPRPSFSRLQQTDPGHQSLSWDHEGDLLEEGPVVPKHPHRAPKKSLTAPGTLLNQLVALLKPTKATNNKNNLSSGTPLPAPKVPTQPSSPRILAAVHQDSVAMSCTQLQNSSCSDADSSLGLNPSTTSNRGLTTSNFSPMCSNEFTGILRRAPSVEFPGMQKGVPRASSKRRHSFALTRRVATRSASASHLPNLSAASRAMMMVSKRRGSMLLFNLDDDSGSDTDVSNLFSSHDSNDVRVNELWFDVEASRFPDPITGEEIILLVQTDVTATVQAEQDTQNILDAEHGLLEQVFPKHVLDVLAIDRAEQQRVGHRWRGTQMAVPANVDALARSHKSVTLMFADIVTYTNMCHETDACTVMAFLNRLFSQLDDLSEKHQVYKVETVGDCYIVAAGLVREDEEEGCRTVDESYVDPDAGRKVLAFARDMLKIASRVCLPTTGEPVKIRVGIHTGPVVSGVIGKRMPRFGVFGDTVNTASRMEANSQPGRIHVSDAAKQAIGDAPPGGVWVPTGGIQVKGKGLMETFFFEAISNQDVSETGF